MKKRRYLRPSVEKVLTIIFFVSATIGCGESSDFMAYIPVWSVSFVSAAILFKYSKLFYR